MRVTAVVAVGNNGVIGNDGHMPWPPTGDMRQFKELTWGHPIVMGRSTFESIGRPLPGRTSVVLTRNATWDSGFPEVLTAGSLREGLALAAEINEDVFLIGGGLVFSEAREADLIDRIVLTEVPLSPEGDAYFAPIEAAVWHEVSRESHEGTPDYEIIFYDRQPPLET